MPMNLAVETRTVEVRGQRITELVPGSSLHLVVHNIAEQTLVALDELGFGRQTPLGDYEGFTIKDLAVDPAGRLVMVQLDVANTHLYDPTAGKAATRGKPTSYLQLITDRVLEQIRVRVSETLGGRVDVWADNHYQVRYVADLSRLGEAAPPTGDLVEHLDAAPGPFHIPLGLDDNGALHWLDLAAAGKHALLTGITGAGKTTWMDTAITTLVRHTPPAALNLVFLDPQRLNFSPYAQLSPYHFQDSAGPLGVAWRVDDVVDALVRLDAEHLRRVHCIGQTPWGSIEGYNAHQDPADRLPYVVVFTDELAVLRTTIANQLDRQALKRFDAALNSLIVGARKVGFRLFLCLQYLKASYLPLEVASQAGLIFAFQNTPQGSKNSLGDTSAALLARPGRFHLQGLPGGRRTLQGLFVSRDQVIELLGQPYRPPTTDVHGLVMEMLTYALQEHAGQLSRDALAEGFGHLMSIRQVGNLLTALEEIGLARPPDRSTVPPRPRQLAVANLAAAREVLQYHPEITFHEAPTPHGVTLVFGTA